MSFEALAQAYFDGIAKYRQFIIKINRRVQMKTQLRFPRSQQLNINIRSQCKTHKKRDYKGMNGYSWTKIVEKELIYQNQALNIIDLFIYLDSLQYNHQMLRIPSNQTSTILGKVGLKASLTTSATYLRNRLPLNIAHRGLSGLFPENTIPSFEAALYSGADFIELDVVFTSDQRLLVMHDSYLHRITNAKQDQFPHARMKRYYPSDDKTYDTQWTDLLTLQELRPLKIKQAQAQGRITSLDYHFGCNSTLEEVIQCVQKFNRLHRGKRNPHGREGGILIEAKDGDMYRQYRPSMPSIGSKILQVLGKYGLDSWQGSVENNCPIFLHSFDDETVKEWHRLGTNLPNHQLIEKSTLVSKEPSGSLVQYAKKMSRYCHGLGVEDTLLYDIQNKRPLLDVVQQIRALDMMLHVWTFKDDSLPFGASTPIEAYNIGQNILKLDGVITEFCDTYSYISHYLAKGPK